MTDPQIFKVLEANALKRFSQANGYRVMVRGRVTDPFQLADQLPNVPATFAGGHVGMNLINVQNGESLSPRFGSGSAGASEVWERESAFR